MHRIQRTQIHRTILMKRRKPSKNYDEMIPLPVWDDRWFIHGACLVSETLKENTCNTWFCCKRTTLEMRAPKHWYDTITLHSEPAIYLAENNIGDKGVLALSEALKQNDAIQGINLGENKIGDECAKETSAALKTTLSKWFALYWHEGAKSLSETLRENNTALQTVRLGGNSIGGEGVRSDWRTQRLEWDDDIRDNPVWNKYPIQKENSWIWKKEQAIVEGKAKAASRTGKESSRQKTKGNIMMALDISDPTNRYKVVVTSFSLRKTLSVLEGTPKIQRYWTFRC